MPVVRPTVIIATPVTSDSIISAHPASGSSLWLYGGTEGAGPHPYGALALLINEAH
jgi:hypothetical protein